MVQIGKTAMVRKGDTVITGIVAGLVMSKDGSEIERIYFQEMTENGFWVSLGWSVSEVDNNIISLVGRNE